jgi:hypothetical protein
MRILIGTCDCGCPMYGIGTMLYCMSESCKYKHYDKIAINLAFIHAIETLTKTVDKLVELADK